MDEAGGDLVEDLRGEVGRLQSELEQAAHYGLAVLQAKEALQQEHEQLETLLESTRQELKSTKDTLCKTQLRHRKVSELGISHEEDFLLEEEALRASISELEVELKNTRLSLDGAVTEKEKAERNAAELGHQVELLTTQKKQLRTEAKELKLREAQMMNDYSELEEENILLQKQVLQLRQSQVEYEVLKQESRRLNEQVEELTAEVESLNRLKEIVERNSQEMLELLHHEREQRSAMRRELDQRISSESMLTLRTLASLGLGTIESNSPGDGDGHSGFEDPDNPTLKKIEADFMACSSPVRSVPEEAQPGDLFSEVHLSQINALEQMLEKLGDEKTALQTSLLESKSRLEEAQKEILEQSEKIHQLRTELESSAKAVVDLVASNPQLEQLAIRYPNYESAVRKILQLEEDMSVLHAQVAELQDQVVKEGTKQVYEDAIKRLEIELASKKDFIAEMESNLEMMRESLGRISDELIRLYYVACDANCETPNKFMQELSKEAKPSTPCKSPSQEVAINDDELAQAVSDEDKPVAVYITCYKLTETLGEQLKCTSRAVDRTIALSRQHAQAGNSEEVTELQEQIIKLRALLVTKREHVLTLRNVLRTNKATAEVAVANLRHRYDHDKAIIAGNMARLRSELKAFKEDAAMFASLRIMFAQRCDEYATTIDQLQRQIAGMEEERRTLNRLLRMAIHQKLALSAKVAELEHGRDPRSQRSFRLFRGRGGTFVYSSLPRSENGTSNGSFATDANPSTS